MRVLISACFFSSFSFRFFIFLDFLACLERERETGRERFPKDPGRSCLLDEEDLIKNAVSVEIRIFRIRFFYIKLKRFLLSFGALSNLIHFIGDYLVRNNTKIYKSLEDCLRNTKVF